MRRGILVVVALGALAGCRDFQLPTLGYQGPLKVVPANLAVAPQEAATFQVEGGTPPYTVSPKGSSGSGASGSDYLAFPLTAQGSGGFAAVAGTQVDYTAGTGDTTAGKGTTDTFVIRDAKGARVTVTVAIGPPVALDFGSAGKPLSVPPGGTVFLGATGGKGPYLFGLASAPSDGLVDAVTGRYRAGSTGCVSDSLLVRDDVGATASVPVNVQCPPKPDSPPDVISSLVADLGGPTARVFYLTSHGSQGGRLELPVYGGTSHLYDLQGSAVAATAPPHATAVVVAVSETDGIHLLAVNPLSTALPVELVAGTGYPIAPGSTLHLESGQSIPAMVSLAAGATWTTPAGVTYAARMAIGQVVTPAIVAGQPATVFGAADATIRAFAGGDPDFLHFFLPKAGGQVQAVVDSGAGMGGQPVLQVPVTFDSLLDAAGSDGPYVALLGTVGGQRFVAMFSLDVTTGTFTPMGLPTQVQDDADHVAFGHFRGPSTVDYVVAGQSGAVRLASFDSAGILQVRSTPWFLPRGIQHLLATDVDGDGLFELLASDDPAGDPAIYVKPSSLPQQAPPQRGVHGAGTLSVTSVGTVAQPTEVPAVLAFDHGRFADGTDAPNGDGGELTLIPGGADTGAPVEVKLPVTGGKVTLVVTARLSPNTLSLDYNPPALVAVVDAGRGEQVWIASFPQPGLAPAVTAVGGTNSPTSFTHAHLAVLPVPGTTPALDAVVIVDDQGLRALTLDANGNPSLSPVTAGQYGWPVPELGDTNNHGLLALEQTPKLMTLARIGLDATGKGLAVTEVPDPFSQATPPPPVVFLPVPGLDLLHAPMIAQDTVITGPEVALVAGGQIVELGTADLGLCIPNLPGTVTDLALIRPTTDGSVIAAVLDAPDHLLETVRLFNYQEALLDRRVLQGSPTSVTAGDVVGNDGVPDIVVGGTPLTILPGVPGAVDTVRQALSCQ